MRPRGATRYDGLHVVLILATFLCSLVDGFLFAFAAVAMPGIRRLDDGGYIRTFQAIDRVIQNGQPLFLLVWGGSILSVLTPAGMGLWQLHGAVRLLVIVAALVHVLGVHLPTVRVNVPLNNPLQRLDPGTMDEEGRRRARISRRVGIDGTF